MKETMLLSQGLIFIPIVISILVYLFNKKLINHIVFPAQLAVTVIVIKLWGILSGGGVVQFTLGGWDKAIGIELSINGLSWLFMVMAVIIWWVILIYAWPQKSKDFKFLFFLMFLEGCFFGLLQVNDFFTFFVLLEIISIISSILIIYKKDGISLKAGLYYLLFNSMGMIIYLFGIMLLYFEIGTLNMTLISEYFSQMNGDVMNYSMIKLSFACILVAMCVKAALFPVYEWLPRAHTAAPTYVSALLSGLLVKTGIYGLIRVILLFNMFDVSDFIYILGFTTALSGTIFAISQKDLKGILAFSTIAHIGLIIMGIAYVSDQGIVGAYLELFNHFLVKSLLFLSVGILINQYGMRRVTDIKGVFRNHPLLSVMMLAAILSITGSPFFVGFISKSLIKGGNIYLYQNIMLRIVSIGKMVIFVHFSKIFFGKPTFKMKLPRIQVFACGILFVILIASYFVEFDFIINIYSLQIHAIPDTVYKSIDYVQKLISNVSYDIEYILSVVFAFILYKLLVKLDSKFWHRMRHFRINFQDAIISLVVFLSVILIVV